jgi:superfamily I DNA/RNA helicase
VTLTRNYRSSPVIVAGAMQAVAPATLVPGRRMSAATGPAPGAAERITVHEAASDRAEGAWIAQAIDKLLGGVSLHSLDTGRADGHAGGKLALADMAVLYRTDAQAAALGQALTRAGLPFQKRSHDLLGRRTAVPEILREMSGVPGPDLGGVSVAKRLGAAVHRLALRSPDARAAGRRTSGGGLSQMDVLAAGEVLAPLALRCGDDVDRFRTEIALGAEADALDPRADAVTLLTIHAAKGLEFSVVFVAGCERDLMPLWLPGKRPAAGGAVGAGTAAAAARGTDVAEERRLLFVAMTRARTHLFLTCAARRRRHSSVAETGPSPFLASIDSRLLDRPAMPRPRRPEASQPRLL